MPTTLVALTPAAKKRRIETRRRHPRYPCGPETFCLVATGPASQLELAAVRNVSRSGVGLILNRNFEPGSLVVVNLFNWRRNFATRVPLRVVHISQQPDGTYFLGGAFAHELCDEEVQWLR